SSELRDGTVQNSSPCSVLGKPRRPSAVQVYEGPGERASAGGDLQVLTFTSRLMRRDPRDVRGGSEGGTSYYPRTETEGEEEGSKEDHQGPIRGKARPQSDREELVQGEAEVVGATWRGAPLEEQWPGGAPNPPSGTMSTGSTPREVSVAGEATAPGPVGLQTLLDLLVGVFQEFRASPFAREKYVSGFLQWAEPLVRQVKKTRIQRDDFDILKVIGRGTFSEVALARMRGTQQVYALKIMNKWDMLKHGETACYQEEREVLVKGDRRWITELYYAFQDDNYLYLVMDYYVGGDLLTLLSKFGDRFPEDMAQFYLAEMVMAIDSVHRLGYVHSSLAVGTPDYLSPEILRAVEGGGGYGLECDWWAVGICAYEMLFGTTPFYAESISETYAKIIHFKEYFEFPLSGPEISEEARGLIEGLICEREVRLGSNGSGDFRKHPFFSNLDWHSLHLHPAPFRPEVSNATDTSNFDVLDDCLSEMETLSDVMDRAPVGVHLAFVGYSYTTTRETGAQDRSQDIMMEIDRQPVRDYESVRFQEKLNPAWEPTDDSSAEVSPLPQPPQLTKQATAELPSRLQEAERRNGELEREMARLRGEIESLCISEEEMGETCCPFPTSSIETVLPPTCVAGVMGSKPQRMPQGAAEQEPHRTGAAGIRGSARSP
ncbi:myotonin-protein kinase-like, partial [Scleropages formosus]